MARNCRLPPWHNWVSATPSEVFRRGLIQASDNLMMDLAQQYINVSPWTFLLKNPTWKPNLGDTQRKVIV